MPKKCPSERVWIFTKVGPAEEVITALVQPDWRPILTYIEAAGMYLNVMHCTRITARNYAHARRENILTCRPSSSRCACKQAGTTGCRCRSVVVMCIEAGTHMKGKQGLIGLVIQSYFFSYRQRCTDSPFSSRSPTYGQSDRSGSTCRISPPGDRQQGIAVFF